MAFSLILGFLFGASDSLADNTAMVDVSISVPMACTMASSVDSAHTTEIENGLYRAEIGRTTFSVTCNDHTGFSVYAIGFSDNMMGNNNLVARVGGELSPSNDIVTGTATSGSISNWAMKLTPVTNAYAPTILSDDDGSFSSYHAVPASYTKVATFSSGTDVVEGSAFTSTYAVYVASAQPSGAYAGQVKYTLVHPANESAPPEPQPSTAGFINYYANASAAEGIMGRQAAADGDTITLFASNFSRNGYGFAGWTDKYDYLTNPNAKFYGPMETITVPEGTTANGLSLYAVWVKSVGSLQDSNKVAELCGTTTTNGTLVQAPAYGTGTANLSSVSALTDQRDNQTYAIAKLADGKCWMIENLRLEAEDSRSNNRFDSSITNESLAQGYNSSFTGLADSESDNFTNSTTPNSLYTTEADAFEKNIISGSNQGYRFPRYNDYNITQRVDNATNSNVNTYGYSNYYTWAAVIADTTQYTGGNHNTTSICPAGWRIPTGNTNGDYYKLNTNINDSSTSVSIGLRAYPANFLYSGYLNDSSVFYRGKYGVYWSSMTYNANTSYTLYLSSSLVFPGTRMDSKYYGFSVRCIVDQP